MQENNQGEEAYINHLKKNLKKKQKEKRKKAMSNTQNYQVVVSKFALQNYGDNGL